MARKLIVLGIDGGELNFIKKFVEEGKLPNFKKIMDKGFYGELESTIPPFTIPAWPTIFTGKNPGEFGFFSFVRWNKDRKDEKFNYRFWRGYFVWDVMKNAKSFIMNVPGTTPGYNINGTMISGPFGNQSVFGESYDPDIDKMLEEHNRKKTSIENEYKKFEERCQIFLNSLEENFDFFVHVIRLTDSVLHLDKGVNLYDVYKKVDGFVGEILKVSEREGMNVLLVSDHGFKFVEKRFNINTFLENVGVLKLRKGKITPIILKIKSVMNSFGVGSLFVKSFILYKKLLGEQRSKELNKKLDFEDKIDWKESLAVSFMSVHTSFASIVFNKKGFFKNGILDDKQCNWLKNFLKEKMENIIDKETGERVIKKIYDGNDIYKGKNKERMPDLIARTRKEYYTHTKNYPGIINKEKNLVHAFDGILMGIGPDIKSGKIKKAKIIDVAPTILKLLKQKIPKDVDGRVIEDVIRGN